MSAKGTSYAPAIKPAILVLTSSLLDVLGSVTLNACVCATRQEDGSQGHAHKSDRIYTLAQEKQNLEVLYTPAVVDHKQDGLSQQSFREAAVLLLHRGLLLLG